MVDMLTHHRLHAMENGPLGSSPMRSRPNGDQPSSRVPQHRLEENRPPPAISKALSSMLKTTTETGDIGMFSIKPPRVPHAPGSPRRVNGLYRDNRPQNAQRPPNFEPYGGNAGVIDDRRRLPSYSRDVTSEVVSLYETASQKSVNRVYDDPDYRSYSMNQTYSQYALTNHRSYSSLRSQPDGGSQGQRPRSPFAYPARLKRHGFRPSSPALTDGGLVDYSRRAEIERGPHVARTASPASIHAQRRIYGPPPLRSNANRSTHSLLSQPSPIRRSVSPLARPDDGTPSSDWLRRYGPISMNSSPARSTLSLASTANPYQVAPAASTTTTPGKPSPLYYDYTEDFDIDDYNGHSVLDPPPQFRIDKTIPEDRPLSASWQKGNDGDPYGTKLRSSSGNSTVIHHKEVAYSHYSCPPSPHSNIPLERKQGQNGHHEVNNLQGNEPTTEKKVIRLSGLGLGAQELSRSVGEAFGLASTPSFELISADVKGGSDGGAIANDSHLSLPNTETIDSASLRTSGYSFNTHLKQFPPPPAADNNIIAGEPSTAPGRRLSSDTFGGRRRKSGDSYRTSSPPSPTRPYTDGAADHRVQYQSLTTNNRKRSSQFLASDSNEENTDPSSKPRSLEKLGSIPLSDSTIVPSVSQLPNQILTSTRYGSISANENGAQVSDETIQVLPDTSSTLGHRPSKKRRVDAVTEPTYGHTDVPNFSHQIPRRLATRSDSPMLAPKPISPARQLKLKNSIPQLMKALPTAPGRPEKPVRTVSPLVQPRSSQTESMPCRFSPLVHEANPGLERCHQQTDHYQNLSRAQSNPSSGVAELDSRPINVVSTIIEDEPQPDVQPAKLKLKMRSFSSLRPISADSRPWNDEDSYPWSESNVQAITPTQPVRGENSSSIKHPKFKLKVIRASNSTLSTVRVNRESIESRSRVGLQLGNPKDLFTTNSGIDNVFSSIRQRLHSRKASNASNRSSLDSKVVSGLGQSSNQEIQEQSDQLTNLECVPASTHAFSPTQVGSWFSVDSIHSHEGINLRKRISNLRSRMITPYASRNAAQSYDDLTWRTQNRVDAPSLSPTRSHPDLHAVRVSVEPERKKGISSRTRVHNLRTRVSEWIKSAKLVFTAHVKRGNQQ